MGSILPEGRSVIAFDNYPSKIDRIPPILCDSRPTNSFEAPEIVLDKLYEIHESLIHENTLAPLNSSLRRDERIIAQESQKMVLRQTLE